MKKESVRRRADAVLLSLLALPCLLAFQADAEMWPLNMLGAAYTWWLFKSLRKKGLFSNYIDDLSDKMD